MKASTKIHGLKTILAASLIACIPSVFAQSVTLGEMSASLIQSFEALERLIGAGTYLAGLGFSVTAIMKFKQHKDNPTQIPIGIPISLVFIGAALLFLPALLEVIESTLFDANSQHLQGMP